MFDDANVEISPDTFYTPNTGGDNTWDRLLFGIEGVSSNSVCTSVVPALSTTLTSPCRATCRRRKCRYRQRRYCWPWDCWDCYARAALCGAKKKPEPPATGRRHPVFRGQSTETLHTRGAAIRILPDEMLSLPVTAHHHRPPAEHVKVQHPLIPDHAGGVRITELPVAGNEQDRALGIIGIQAALLFGP